MSKLVFFNILAYGHTNPTLGVVRELVAGGIRSGTIPSRPFKRSFRRPARPLSPVTMPRWG